MHVKWIFSRVEINYGNVSSKWGKWKYWTHLREFIRLTCFIHANRVNHWLDVRESSGGSSRQWMGDDDKRTVIMCNFSNRNFSGRLQIRLRGIWPADECQLECRTFPFIVRPSVNLKWAVLMECGGASQKFTIIMEPVGWLRPWNGPSSGQPWLCQNGLCD